MSIRCPLIMKPWNGSFIIKRPEGRRARCFISFPLFNHGASRRRCFVGHTLIRIGKRNWVTLPNYDAF